MKLKNVSLQFITHYTERYSYIDSARIALEGGCRWIQLRMKDADETLLEETALIVQKMCKEYDATFIIDDNVHLCKKIKADGVHLGKNDMPIAEARKILGDDFIIGATVNTFDDVLLCQQSTDNRLCPQDLKLRSQILFLIISVVVLFVLLRRRKTSLRY